MVESFGVHSVPKEGRKPPKGPDPGRRDPIRVPSDIISSVEARAH
jgi:hypothetical protein